MRKNMNNEDAASINYNFSPHIQQSQAIGQERGMPNIPLNKFDKPNKTPLSNSNKASSSNYFEHSSTSSSITDQNNSQAISSLPGSSPYLFGSETKNFSQTRTYFSLHKLS